MPSLFTLFKQYNKINRRVNSFRLYFISFGIIEPIFVAWKSDTALAGAGWVGVGVEGAGVCSFAEAPIFVLLCLKV